ncbi:hypothetical protein [Nostoc sp.]|uniref:hypothetical protein n=1 Tax=Nostoc sp. TaxID=1180 RepID=UPI002FF86D25
MKLSTIIKGSVCVLGLVGVGNSFASPAFAGDASARGAVTVVRSSGSSISVSAELTAPTGAYFTGPTLVITPTYTGTAGSNAEQVDTLTIDPGAVAFPAAPPSATIQAAVAAQIDLISIADVQDLATLVRAASVNGGLE